MNKVIYIDTETSGLDPSKNALLQIAGIIEINGIEKEYFNYYVRPIKGKIINQKALECNNLTFNQIESFEDPSLIYSRVLAIFDKYIAKFDKNDKFIMVGQNPWFDKTFIDQFFKDQGNQYLHAYIDYHLIDLVGISMFMKSVGKISCENLKLETICKSLEIPLKAHDAMEDCRAVKLCLEKFMKMV